MAIARWRATSLCVTEMAHDLELFKCMILLAHLKRLVKETLASMYLSDRMWKQISTQEIPWTHR